MAPTTPTGLRCTSTRLRGLSFITWCTISFTKEEERQRVWREGGEETQRDGDIQILEAAYFDGDVARKESLGLPDEGVDFNARLMKGLPLLEGEEPRKVLRPGGY